MDRIAALNVSKLNPSKVWYVLLVSFLLDSYIAAHPSLQKITTSADLNLIVIVLLFIAVIFNSEDTRNSLFIKLSSLHKKSESENSIHKIIMFAALSVVLTFEFLNLFGKAINQHFVFIVLLLTLVSFSLYKHYKEHKKHALLMKTDSQYYYSQIGIQKLLITLIPAVSSRLAAVITATLIYSTGASTPFIFQYLICIFIFIQSQPE